jgi:hypothetical protein
LTNQRRRIEKERIIWNGGRSSVLSWRRYASRGQEAVWKYLNVVG